ncbi:helix-turn-helix domain-containing protein [Rhodococcus pyridinivorans]|uniref:helix-turn-helix transcriptional regulator n=1 Tax=Rhodococcus pyridinivorans TaxID=103816 RepID=UPI001FFF01B0|nr:helix-turn-helix domain-containing protein [Rhodococcus pyridinivorans]UPK64656.1 helix-turn-helix domain-containing protein [Rhodococcus pyridinivorans]
MTEPSAATPLLSVQQMAVELGIPTASLYQKRHRGDFPRSYKIGGSIRVKREDFEAWLESKVENA